MAVCGNLLECYNKAVETLEKGFELTGDERIKAALAALRSENEETSETEAAVEETETEETPMPEADIPSDAFEYNGHSYYVFSDICETWEDAEKYCESLGGYLAVINNDDENTAVYDIMKQQGYESAYFGYTDVEEDGNWHWIDGKSSSYTNWNRYEPSDGFYAMFYWKWEYTWNDGTFDDKTDNGGMGFICEWDESGREDHSDGSLFQHIFGTSEPTVTNGKCGDDAYWDLSYEGMLIISGSGAVTDNPWLANRSAIKKVIIRDNITSLCANAFAYCEEIDEVDFGYDLESVGDYAFIGCKSLENLNCFPWQYQIPKNVRYIGQCAFIGCEKIKEIDIPSGITELSNAFLDCSSLESIFIPSSVTVFNRYDDNADTLFDGCNGLTIYCEEGSEAEKYAIGNNIDYRYIFVNKWDDTFGYLSKYSGTGVVKYLGKSFVGSSGEG